jgi:hypothetical protein
MNNLLQTQRRVERERTHEDKNLGIRVLRRGLIVLTLTLQVVVLADKVIQSLRVFFVPQPASRSPLLYFPSHGSHHIIDLVASFFFTYLASPHPILC